MFSDKKKDLQEKFDVLSDYYDKSSSYFSETTTLLLQQMQLPANSHCLDVCTGTGIFALDAAKKMPNSQIIGVDISTKMLEQAKNKALLQSLNNVSFEMMDIDNLTFDDDYFDATVCNFGLFLLDDMATGLQQMVAKTKVGGKVAFSVWDKKAFMPLQALLKQDYNAFINELSHKKIQPWSAESGSPIWQVLAEDNAIHSLCDEAGLSNINIHHQDLGYFVEDTQRWWNIVWNSTNRSTIFKPLSTDELQQFKQYHLSHITRLREKEKIWLDIGVITIVADKK
jgi:ubiquinone/menaquinone biosynthesis C-methylase UbiE